MPTKRATLLHDATASLLPTDGAATASVVPANGAVEAAKTLADASSATKNQETAVNNQPPVSIDEADLEQGVTTRSTVRDSAAKANSSIAAQENHREKDAKAVGNEDGIDDGRASRVDGASTVDGNKKRSAEGVLDNQETDKNSTNKKKQKKKTAANTNKATGTTNSGKSSTGNAAQIASSSENYKEDGVSSNSEEELLDTEGEDDVDDGRDDEQDKVEEEYSNGDDVDLNNGVEEEEESIHSGDSSFVLETLIKEDVNEFGVVDYIKKDQQAMPLVVNADTNIQKIGLLPLSFFVHQTEEFLFCKLMKVVFCMFIQKEFYLNIVIFLLLFKITGQPCVNHRTVSLETVKSILIPAALEDKTIGKGFEEEMFVIVYEVTNTKDCNTVPMYCTYLTDTSEKATPSELHNVYAKFPTRGGMRELLRSLNLNELMPDGEDSSLQDSDPFLPSDLVFKIFNSDLFQNMSYSNKNFFDKTNAKKKLTKTEGTASRSTMKLECYRRLKNVFQSEHNIRFAFLGGSHRIATAVHFFGGYEILPNKILGQKPKLHDYGFVENMKINASPSCTIFFTKEKLLNEEFISQCCNYSYILEKKKTESINVGLASLSMNILDEKKHKGLSPEFRFLIDDVFQSEAVSKVLFKHFSIGILQQLGNIPFSFSFSRLQIYYNGVLILHAKRLAF